MKSASPCWKIKAFCLRNTKNAPFFADNRIKDLDTAVSFCYNELTSVVRGLFVMFAVSRFPPQAAKAAAVSEGGNMNMEVPKKNERKKNNGVVEALPYVFIALVLAFIAVIAIHA